MLDAENRHSHSSKNKLLWNAHCRITQAWTMYFIHPTRRSSLSSDTQVKTNETRRSSDREWLLGPWVGGFRAFFFSFFSFVSAQTWVSPFYQDPTGITERRLHLWVNPGCGSSPKMATIHSFPPSMDMLFHSSRGSVCFSSPRILAGLSLALIQRMQQKSNCSSWGLV